MLDRVFPFRVTVTGMAALSVASPVYRSNVAEVGLMVEFAGVVSSTVRSRVCVLPALKLNTREYVLTARVDR